MLWRSIKTYGTPRPKKLVIVTVEDANGDRYIDFDIRFIDAKTMKENHYKDEFIAQHPNGIWEWAYEMGADYWEQYDGNVIAWADPQTITPYLED